MNALMKFQKFRQIKQQQMQNKTVGLQPKRLFGLRNDVLGNIHFAMTKYEIIYPAANVIVIQNFVTNEQKFLRLPENINPEIIVISPNRKLIAIAELNIITEKTTIAIYDIEELKRLKTLQLAVECPIQAVGNMCFTSDSRGMAVLSREPDAFITIYTFGKNDTMVTGRASNKNYPGRANLVKCNPSDTSIITVGGENMMKIMNKTEKGFGQLGTIKGDNIDVTALTWLSGEIIIAGSAKMELFFIEGGELKAQYNMTDVDVIDLTQPDADETSQRQSTIVHLLATKTYPIKCLTTFKTGFAFATHNMVHVFQKESSHKFIKTTLLVIPVQLFDASLYVISNIAVNEEEDTIVATTQHSQLFVGQLFAPETIGISQIEFKFLGEPLHIDSIIDLSVCSWKPIIMTLSKDLTVRIWNYETMKVELIKKFLIDLRCISLHPSGFIAAIAFTDIVRFYQIQLRDLKLLKSFNYSRTTVLQFSHRGHLIAIGCQKEISIVCVFTFETHHTLVGHKDVLSVAWSTDDRYLVSSGKEGSVYEWDLTTGQRINELVQKGTLYRSLAVSSDQSYIVGVTHTAFLREISKSELIREFRAPDDSPLTTLAFSRSDQMLFAANERGCLYNIKMPFLESGGGNFSNYRFYHKAINKLCITYDDSTLVSVGDDGTLVFWAITNAEIKMAEMDSDLGHIEDVLIARQELLEIEHQMNLLQMRINEQVSEFMYEKEQGESYFTDQMNDIHAKYSEEINELRQKFVQQDAYHIEQLNELTMTLTKSNEKHQREVEELEANFNEKIIVEYENQKALKKKVDEVIELYEEKLRKSSSCLQETIDGLEANFKKQIEEKNEYVETLMKEMKDKEKEFQEYCRQVEIDHDRNMVESQLSYEKRLKDSDEIIGRWRGDAGVLRKKNATISKESDELRKEIELLNVQKERFLATIRNNERNIEELKHDIENRDMTIRVKDKAVFDLMKRTQDLEKNKQALTHKVNELKMELEPRDIEIHEKKERIFEMERELKLLQQTHLHAGLRLSEMKDKYFAAEKELDVERTRAKTARKHLMRICADIYDISNFIQYPDKLKEEVIKLFHRYSNNPELKKTLIIDSDVQKEFIRQREYFEKIIFESKNKNVKKKSECDTVKLLKENVTLITELNRLRQENRDLKRENSEMQAILGISTRQMLPSVAKKKLEKATLDKEQIERMFKNKIDKLEEEVKILIEENQNLRMQISE